MISSKRFMTNGSNKRFLSDFIIRSEQFSRVYIYEYDNTLPSDGTGDVLQDTNLPWTFPTNLYRRGLNFPVTQEDLVTIDKFDLVDNSIVYYLVPPAGNTVYIEVATTAEEFGDTLVAPSVEKAEAAAAEAGASAGESAASAVESAASAVDSATSATASQISEWNSEASRRTADSYATEPQGVFVNIHTSNGDGTYTITPTTEYSSLHYSQNAGFDLGTLTDVTITTPVLGESLVYNDVTGEWENGEVLGLPEETGHLGKSLTNSNVKGDGFWSYVNTNPNIMTTDQVMDTGTSASVVSGFTIADGITLTIPEGSALAVI